MPAGSGAGNMSFHLKKNRVSYQLNRDDSYKDVVDFRTKKMKKKQKEKLKSK